MIKMCQLPRQCVSDRLPGTARPVELQWVEDRPGEASQERERADRSAERTRNGGYPGRMDPRSQRVGSQNDDGVPVGLGSCSSV